MASLRTSLAALVLVAVPVAPALTGCSSTVTDAGPTSRGGSSGSSTPTADTPAVAQGPASAAAELRRIEQRHAARLGVYALDVATGRSVSHRANERFAFASTGKVLAAALLLRARDDRALNHVIRYDASDLQAHSPVTTGRLRTGMTRRELVEAALQYSDNTAANLVVEDLGGPAEVQKGVRSIGDETTRVDRVEPELNEAARGDLRDTTTPRAIAMDLQGLVLGNLLAPSRRAELTRLMVGNTTGGPYIRAGVPSGWRVADRTGAGGHGTRNDIAVLWSPTGEPVVLALLSDRLDPGARSDDTLLAEATAAVVRALS